MNSRCYCGNALTLRITTRDREWTCRSCFRTINKEIKPYICRSPQTCIYSNTEANADYRACEDCFKSKDSIIHQDELKTNDKNDMDGQSFVYRKFKSILARLS